MLKIYINIINIYISKCFTYIIYICCCAKSLQLCLKQFMCNPMNCSQPGSSVPGVIQVDYWSKLPFTPHYIDERKERWKWKSLSHVRLFVTPMDHIVHRIPQARTLEWVTVLFSWGSSQPTDWTQVSWVASRFFTNWATREAQEYWNG